MRRRHAAAVPPSDRRLGRRRITPARSEAARRADANDRATWTRWPWRASVVAAVVFTAAGKAWLGGGTGNGVDLRVRLSDLPFLAAALVFATTLLYWLLLPGPARILWPHPRLPLEEAFRAAQWPGPAVVVRTLGLASLLAGSAGMLWSSRALGHAWSALERTPTRLVVDGPFAAVRHPVYLSALFIMGGIAAISRNRIVLVGCVALWCTVAARIPSEDRALQETFGDTEAWSRWASRVPTLFPSLH